MSSGAPGDSPAEIAAKRVPVADLLDRGSSTSWMSDDKFDLEAAGPT